MPLINCKVELSLNWIERYLLTVANTATFKITDAKLYVPVVTLKTEDNTKLSKLLSEKFKRPIYWNEYKVISNRNYGADEYIREWLDASIQGVRKLFLPAMVEKTTTLQKIVTGNIFFQEEKLKIITLKVMEEIFMTNQLVTRLSNTMNSEKYQQDRVMITKQVVYWMFISKMILG